MLFSIFTAIFSILILIILHELGHFLLAKKFGVKVEEFGIGIPLIPALVKKRFGETVYAFYPLLFGAFVRLKGEEKGEEGPASFSQKPLWQRMCIVAGGVAFSWIGAVALFAVLLATIGIPAAAIQDDEKALRDLRIHIMAVAPESPAQNAGVLPGDILLELQTQQTAYNDFSTIQEVQEIIRATAGESLSLKLQRGEEVVAVSLIPRAHPPAAEGPIGVALARVGFLIYPWHEAPLQGLLLTGRVTFQILEGFGQIASRLVGGQGLPPGVDVSGPIGVVALLQESLNFGIANFLYLCALLAIYLALFNTLPIPALDGGRLVFLIIEGIIRRPLSEKFTRTLIAASFMILIPLILWVTVQDLQKLFL